MFAMDIAPSKGDEHDDASGAEAGTPARGGWRVPGGIMCKIAFFLLWEIHSCRNFFCRNRHCISLWLVYNIFCIGRSVVQCRYVDQ